MTNKNGFWNGWLDLLALLLQLHIITIAYNSSKLVTKTRSIPYWTTSVFSFIVTDLVLIYESVTSSVFVFRWLTLHSWTLNYDCDLTVFSSMYALWRLYYERLLIYESTTVLRMTWLTTPVWLTSIRVRVRVRVTLRLTVSQSGPSWCRAPSVAHDQIFIPVRKLLSSLYGAPSLTRGRVCHLTSIKCESSFYNSGRTENRPSPQTVRRLLCLFAVTRTCPPKRSLAMDYSGSIRCSVNVC
jgi:hypothetical protein